MNDATGAHPRPATLPVLAQLTPLQAAYLGYLARHDDPRTTSRHYDLGRENLDRHAVHILAARLAA